MIYKSALLSLLINTFVLSIQATFLPPIHIEWGDGKINIGTGQVTKAPPQPPVNPNYPQYPGNQLPQPQYPENQVPYPQQPQYPQGQYPQPPVTSAPQYPANPGQQPQQPISDYTENQILEIFQPINPNNPDNKTPQPPQVNNPEFQYPDNKKLQSSGDSTKPKKSEGLVENRIGEDDYTGISIIGPLHPYVPGEPLSSTKKSTSEKSTTKVKESKTSLKSTESETTIKTIGLMTTADPTESKASSKLTESATRSEGGDSLATKRGLIVVDEKDKTKTFDPWEALYDPKNENTLGHVFPRPEPVPEKSPKEAESRPTERRREIKNSAVLPNNFIEPKQGSQIVIEGKVNPQPLQSLNSQIQIQQPSSPVMKQYPGSQIQIQQPTQTQYPGNQQPLVSPPVHPVYPGNQMNIPQQQPPYFSQPQYPGNQAVIPQQPPYQIPSQFPVNQVNAPQQPSQYPMQPQYPANQMNFPQMQYPVNQVNPAPQQPQYPVPSQGNQIQGNYPQEPSHVINYPPQSVYPNMPQSPSYPAQSQIQQPPMDEEYLNRSPSHTITLGSHYELLEQKKQYREEKKKILINHILNKKLAHGHR